MVALSKLHLINMRCTERAGYLALWSSVLTRAQIPVAAGEIRGRGESWGPEGIWRSAYVTVLAERPFCARPVMRGAGFLVRDCLGPRPADR